MIPLFLGLAAANLLLLSIVFVLGLLTAQGLHAPTGWYAYHLGLGVAAGLMTLLAHLAVFTYFMATSKWLAAATAKGNLDPARFTAPARARKSHALAATMSAIAVVMLAMVAGAGGDPAYRPLWPPQVHLWFAMFALIVNVLATVGEYRLIRLQGWTIDAALAIINASAQPGSERTFEVTSR